MSDILHSIVAVSNVEPETNILTMDDNHKESERRRKRVLTDARREQNRIAQRAYRKFSGTLGSLQFDQWLLTL
jgi:hypothetical protein